MMLTLVSCHGSSDQTPPQGGANDGLKTKEATASEITVYTHRHYESDQRLFELFTEQTDIQVNVVNASADELLFKLEQEGGESPADVLITVDAGRLYMAKQKKLLQSCNSELLEQQVPPHLRDSDRMWFGLTKRARVIAYHPDRVSEDELSSYEDLSNPKWKGKLLIRSSGNIYNQSLLAAIIANSSESEALTWANRIVGNMARSPKGNDRDQIKAIMAGEGDIAVVNTYYLGKLINSKDPQERAVGKKLRIFFPGQGERGTHVNISGAGLCAHAPNKENAIRFIEFLTSAEAQGTFSSSNYEYPVNPAVSPDSLLMSWGTFRDDTLSLSELGRLNRTAVLIFDKAGWK